MDQQLTDANEAVSVAEEALIAIEMSEADVKGRSKDLAKKISIDKLGLLYALTGSDTYKKFIMKYRNYRSIFGIEYNPFLLLWAGG